MNKEERYKKFLQEYAYFDEEEAEENKSKTIEEVFLEMCEYWAGDWRDFETREIKSIFSRAEIFAKNIALKYLIEKGFDIENALFVLGGDMNVENLFEYKRDFKDNEKDKIEYLGK